MNEYTGVVFNKYSQMLKSLYGNFPAIRMSSANPKEIWLRKRLHKRLCLAQLFHNDYKRIMNTDPNQQPVKQQSEDADKKDINLTNSNATLTEQTPKQADSPTMSDNATSAGNDNLTQSVINGSEINPEYGDAADPTFETL